MNNRKKLKQVLRDFWHHSKAVVLIYLLTTASFSVVYLFGELPFYFWRMSMQLSVSFLVFYLLISGYVFLKSYRHPQNMSSDQLEESENMLSNHYPDKYYLKWIHELDEQRKDIQEKTSIKQKEQSDYFTLWLHQIKTPISAISLLIQQTEDRELAQKLKQELLRVDEYTTMALSYVKMEDPAADMDLRKVALDSVIKKSLKRYSILFIMNQITLDYEKIDFTVFSDEKWLQVVLEQILSNSLKYAVGGKIMIYLDGKRLVIEDNGSGIPPEDLPRIFTRGFSGFPNNTYEKQTGLGLFLSKKICQRLGHSIHVESDLNQGTKVFIDLSQDTSEPWE